MAAKDPKPEFRVGDKVRVNLHHGKIEDAVVRAVIHDSDGLKLQVDFGYEQAARSRSGRLLRSDRRLRMRA